MARFRDFFVALRNKLLGKFIVKSRLVDKFSVVCEGEPTFELIHEDGSIDRWTIKNIVTQRASVLVQKLLMMQSGTAGITHLALGLGDPRGEIPNNCVPAGPWACDAPPAAPIQGGRTDQSGMPVMVDELARKKIDTRQYLNEDDTVSQFINGDGTIISVPTHIGIYKALFLETEGNGPIMEFGLFGGNVQPDEFDYIPSYQTDENGVLLKDGDGRFIRNEGSNILTNPGDMVTYKTHKLFYKTSKDRLRVSYKLKIALNNAPPEPAAE